MMTAHATWHRTIRSQDPFGIQPERGYAKQGEWPARWISHPEVTHGPAVVDYRLRLNLAAPAEFNLHVTADERYELYLADELLGRGPERSDEDHWPFESFQIRADAGEHEFRVRVWSAGELRAFAQSSHRHGLLVATTHSDLQPLINTGEASWSAQQLPQYEFIPPADAWGTGGNIRYHADRTTPPARTDLTTLYPGIIWDTESEYAPIPLLIPAKLPPMRLDAVAPKSCRHVQVVDQLPTNRIPFEAERNDSSWHRKVSAWLQHDRSLTIPPETTLRILLDFDDYVCARQSVAWTGSGLIRLHWQEALFHDDGKRNKGNRDEIEGKYFTTIWSWDDGIGDIIHAVNEGEYQSLWWHAGRYVEMVIKTESEPIELHHLTFESTGYPYVRDAEFRADHPDIEGIDRIGFRTLEVCSHETYMDCPYYEQLQYVGDTRLQALVTYVTTSDRRLPEQAIRAFDYSRRNRGITYSRYPSRVRQIIPPFSLWWVCMLADALLYGADVKEVKNCLPGARQTMEYFARHITESGLLAPVPGWNFVDWVPGWRDGVPPTGMSAPCAPVNLQYLLALESLAFLETHLGDPRLAEISDERRHVAQTAIRQAFWNPEHQRLSDDLGHAHASQHSQSLGLLSGVLSPAEAAHALDQSGLAETTIYFTHYLFEAYYRLGRGDQIVGGLPPWSWHLTHGLRTTLESPEPTRSDCHAWGAHPIFHFYSSLMGIRPVAPGYRQMRVAPSPGPLSDLECRYVTPFGHLFASLRNDTLSLTVPTGIEVEVDWRGNRAIVTSGVHTFTPAA
ncbi:MAG: hypothetical protein SFX74_03970 [Fimbriimonadaceae bacterium]|nr:hypothetical protein [Fimbriimonadaceae bacterium]